MNIPRSALQRRRFIQSGSVLAVGAVTSLVAGRQVLRGLSRPRCAPDLAAAPVPDPAPPQLDPSPVDPPEIELHGPPIPPEPPPRPLENEDHYADFLASLDLRHLAPHEIIDPHRGIERGIPNSLPPERLWKKLVPTLKLADEIRERLELPLCRITSAYRAPDYNAAIPGAVPGSYHTRNQALDVVYYCSPRTAYQMALQLRREGFFRGGIGLYSSFIHLDTRGYPATWTRA